MTRRLGVLGVVLCFLVALVASTQTVQALGLKVAPLEYRATIGKGEKQKGFIDISNPNLETIRVKTSVQAFRQTDDNGTLEFFDSEQVSAGVKLDLDEFELKGREAVRMYFLLDGTKLPKGDVFAAIFFTSTDGLTSGMVNQQVRLGTLLSLVNETPGSRDAVVEKLNTSFVQFGATTKGSYEIKNTAQSQTTGFYPEVTLSSWPFGKTQKSTSRLVFAGRTRATDFELQLPPLGLYKVTATYGGSSKTNWILVLHPLFLVSLGILAGITVALVILRKQRRRKSDFF